MPSLRKKNGGLTLTFAPRNEDVRLILLEKKDNEGLVLTDYICEAIRFYEKHNHIPPNLDNIIKVIQDTIESTLHTHILNKSSHPPTLEDNLDFVDCEDD